jgi:hypothetical protein
MDADTVVSSFHFILVVRFIGYVEKTPMGKLYLGIWEII